MLCKSISTLILFTVVAPFCLFAVDVSSQERFRDRDKLVLEPFYGRLGITTIKPELNSGGVVLSNVPSLSQSAISNGEISGSSGAKVNDASIATLTLGYRLPGNQRFSLETVLAAPRPIKIKNSGTLASQSVAPTANILGLEVQTGIPAFGEDFGETKAAPPLVTLVYQLTEPGSAFSPYIGGGLFYFYTYDSKVTNKVLTEISEPEFTISNPISFVGQVGFNYNFTDKWWINTDFKYIKGGEQTATLKGIRLKTEALGFSGVVSGGDATIKSSLDAMAFSFNLGFNF